MKFRIENTVAGCEIGTYEAGSAKEALEKMFQNAGYNFHGDEPMVFGGTLEITRVE